MAALVIRFHELGAKSFWLDELLTMHAARFDTINEVLAWAEQWLYHPPLHFVLTWLLRPFGADEWIVRLPAAIAGTAAVATIIGIGMVVGRTTAGLIAAAWIAALPFTVWYSQDARPYALILLWTSLQMLAATWVVRSDKTLAWAALIAFSMLNLYTGFVAVAATAAVAVYIAIAVLRRRYLEEPGEKRDVRGTVLKAMLACALIVIGCLPIIEQMTRALGSLAPWLDPTYEPAIEDLAKLLATMGLADPLVLVLMAVGAGATLWRAARGDWTRSGLLVSWFAVPIAGLLVRAGGAILLVWPQYLIFLLPPAALFIGIGAEVFATRLIAIIESWRPRTRSISRMATLATLAAILVLIMAPISQQLPALYATAKGDDFREAAALVDFGSPAVVMVAGENAAWLVEGINDYSWLRGSPTIAIDAAALDDAAIAVIEASMVVTGAVLLSQPENAWAAVPPPDWRLEIAFRDCRAYTGLIPEPSRHRIGDPELGGDPRPER